MARNKYDVDEVLEDKFDLNQLKRLLAYLIPYRKRFVSVGFMMLSASAFTMLIPQFFQKVMDVCIPNKDMKGIAFYSFLTLLAAFYSAFSLRYKIKYTNQIGQQIIHDMRYDIFEHLQELPFSYYDDRPHGKIQVRVVNYVNSISDLLSNGILNTIFDGYAPFKGELNYRKNGSLIAFEAGESITYGLFNAQERGNLFIGPGVKVYSGMVVGECPKAEDIELNVCKTKKLTNTRSSSSDEALKLTPPKDMSLEQCLDFIDTDELLEVTPKNLRIRKKILDPTLRKRAMISKKNQ